MAGRKEKRGLGKNHKIARNWDRYYFLGSRCNQYDHIIVDAAKKYGLDPVELKSLLQKESGERIYRFAIGRNGEVGPGQLMFGTARGLGLNSEIKGKVINIEPEVKRRRVEEHRLGYLERFQKKEANWRGPDVLEKIEKALGAARKSATRYLRDEVGISNQVTLKTLRDAAKDGSVKLKAAFTQEIAKSQQAIRENSNSKLRNKLRAAKDYRINIRKSILASALYLSRKLEETGASYDVEHYKKAEVAYKRGSLRGKAEWVKKDTTTVEAILRKKYKGWPTFVKEVLGENGRLKKLQEYREANRPYKFDRYVVLARGEKGNGSLEKPHKLAIVKRELSENDVKMLEFARLAGPFGWGSKRLRQKLQTIGDEKYVSLTSGQLYDSLDSACKEFKWTHEKKELVRVEGKTIRDAEAKLKARAKELREDLKKQDKSEGKQGGLLQLEGLPGAQKRIAWDHGVETSTPGELTAVDSSFGAALKEQGTFQASGVDQASDPGEEGRDSSISEAARDTGEEIDDGLSGKFTQEELDELQASANEVQDSEWASSEREASEAVWTSPDEQESQEPAGASEQYAYTSAMAGDSGGGGTFG